MPARFLLVVVALFAVSTAQASSVTLSDSATDSTVGVNQSLALSDSGSVYVWVTPDTGQTINGLGLDVIASDPGVLEATAITIFNPTYSIIDDPRWNSTNSGTLGDLFTGTNAVAVSGANGIDEGASSLDGGTVDAAGAFLHAVVDFTATGVGTTSLTPQANDNFITAEGEGQISPSFTGGTVTVIPEPTTLVLLGAGGLLALRRKRHA